MEGKRTYEESYKELRKVANSLSTESTIIDFSKLDSTTSGKIREALAPVIHQRIREVADVLSRVE